MGASGSVVLQVSTQSSLRIVMLIRIPTVKAVNNKNLKNVIMQLRKVCQHPFLFHWPKDPVTHELALSDELVNASGKMMVLERLLDELFARDHKVLLFSQFTTMLDIIQASVTSRLIFPALLTSASVGLGPGAQALAGVPHRRQHGHGVAPGGHQALPGRRGRARCAAALPPQHALRRPRYQPSRR